jgi:hypothetical protein
MTKPGDRIELIRMPDDPHPVATGTRGTVTNVNLVKLGREEFTQVGVDWDDGRSLMLVSPPDEFRILA